MWFGYIIYTCFYKYGICCPIRDTYNIEWFVYLFLCSSVFTCVCVHSTAQASCLVDEPKQIGQYKYPEQLPGQLYDADIQCKWQFGLKAKLCSLDFVKVTYSVKYAIRFLFIVGAFQ